MEEKGRQNILEDNQNDEPSPNDKAREADGSDDNVDEIIEMSSIVDSESGKVSSKGKTSNKIRGHHWYDMLFAITLFVVFAFELICLIWYKTCPNTFTWKFASNIFADENINSFLSNHGVYINEVIMTLFPIFVSILNISISVSSQEIYGLKLSNFRKLDKRMPYTLLGMTILSFSMLLLSVILYCFGLFLSLIVLNVFSFIYVVYFCWLVIPLLTRSEKTKHGSTNAIKNGLEYYAIKYMKDIPNTESTSKAKEDLWIDDLKIAVGNFAATHGLENTVSSLFKANDDYSQFDFIFKQYCGVVKSSFTDKSENNIAVLDSTFSDLLFYFDKLHSGLIPFNKPYDVTDISSLIYFIFDYVETNNLKANYRTNLYFLYHNFLPQLRPLNKKTKPFTDSISNFLLIKSMNENNLFLCNWIKDEAYHSPNLELDPHYIIYASIYLYYLENNSSTNARFKKEIKTYFDSEWKEVIKNRCSLVLRCSSILRLSNLFEDLVSYQENFEYVRYYNKLYYVNERFPFDVDYITSWLITAYFLGEKDIETGQAFINELERTISLNSNKKQLRDVLKREWVNTDSGNFNANYTFVGYFKQSGFSIVFSSKRSESVKNDLIEYSKHHEITKLKEEANLSDIELAKIEAKCSARLKREISKIPILDKKIDLSDDAKPYRFTLELHSTNCSELLNYIDLGNEKSDFFRRLKNRLIRALCQENAPDKYLTDSFLSKILLTAKSEYYLVKKKHKTHYFIDFDDFTYDRETILINLEPIPDTISLKHLNADETNEYLDKDFYGSSNGYYYFDNDSKTKKYYANRNELKKDVGATWYQLSFTIKFNVKFNFDLTEKLN